MSNVPTIAKEADVAAEEAWMRMASTNEVFAFLANPAEDIYTPEDGKPMEDAFLGRANAVSV